MPGPYAGRGRAPRDDAGLLELGRVNSAREGQWHKRKCLFGLTPLVVGAIVLAVVVIIGAGAAVALVATSGSDADTSGFTGGSFTTTQSPATSSSSTGSSKNGAESGNVKASTGGAPTTVVNPPAASTGADSQQAVSTGSQDGGQNGGQNGGPSGPTQSGQAGSGSPCQGEVDPVGFTGTADSGWPAALDGITITRYCDTRVGYSGTISRTCANGVWSAITGQCVKGAAPASTAIPTATSTPTPVASSTASSSPIKTPSSTASTTPSSSCPQDTQGPRDTTDILKDGFYWPSTAIGQKATLSCAAVRGLTSKFQGTVTRECLAGGQWASWDKIVQDCLERCAATTEEAQSANGIKLGAVWPMTQNGQTATLACPSGYTGSVSRQCRSWQWQEVTGECAKEGQAKTCPQSGQRGRNFRPESPVGATVATPCRYTVTGPTAYALVGTKTYTCLASGAWDDGVGECVRGCDAESGAKSDNGVSLGADWPITKEGAPASLACPAGYTGTVTRTCVDDGAAQMVATVKGACTKQGDKTSCPQDTQGPRDTTDLLKEGFYWPSTAIGQKATLSCAAVRGLTSKFQGTVTRECLAGGQWASWDKIVQDCLERCAATTEEAQSANGIKLGAVWPMTQNGQTATLACPSGYTGSVSRQCRSWQWQEVTGECAKEGQAKTCPQSGQRGRNFRPESPVGATVATPCRYTVAGPTAYALVGTKTYTCLASGAWDDGVGECVRGCDAESGAKSDNGVSLGADWPITKEGAPASLACPAGYTGTVTRTCVDDGAAQMVATVRGACTKQGAAKTCPEYRPVYYESWPETPAGETAKLPCGTHSQISVGWKYQKCNEDGKWSGVIDGNCHTGCDTDFDAKSANGVKLDEPWKDAEFDEVVTLPCPKQASYTGTVKRKCNKVVTPGLTYGQWGEPEGICVRV